LGFERYGDVVVEAVLGDLPPADELTSQRIAEARLLYREWQNFWNRHEYWAQSQVRSGWVCTVGLDVARGRTTRINRLSLDGVTNVTNDDTWLDNHVAQLFNLTNLPLAFMPGEGLHEGQIQEVTRYLIVGDTADYWPVGNSTEEAGNENDGDVNDMETADEEEDQPRLLEGNVAEPPQIGQPRAAQKAVQSQLIQSSRPL
jgi:hypothetical protein